MKDTTMEDLCAKVHKNAIETVADTTAGTTIDILNELLQNARMAEATRIDIEIKDHRITVTDNGHGILNPEAILTYGQIAWKDKRLSQEAAGIGLFALSNRSVEIASRQEAAATGNEPKGWIVYLTPEAFRGWTPAFPEYSDLAPKPHGTRVSYYGAQVQTWVIEQMVRHFPVPVHVNGHKARQVPFLTNPETAISWEGLRVDVTKGRPGRFGKSRMSFHGTVSVLPLTVTAGSGWANIEVVHCPRLRMVRPGFRTISDNRFAQDLLVWLEAELR